MDTQDLNERNEVPPPNPETAPASTEPATAGEWLRQNGSILFVVALITGWVFTQYGLDGLLTALEVMFGLGFVIFIHELGHFSVAKWCDVHVETFSIGFGPPLPGCKFQRGETTYMIALFPLGGYVKMVGEGSEGDDEDTDPRSFKNKGVLQRMAIISAGVFMNVVLAMVCFIFVYMAHGRDRPPGVIGQVENGSPAWKIGLQTGMEIVQMKDEAYPTFDHLTQHVVLSEEGEKLDVVARLPGEKPVSIQIEPRKTKEEGRPVIGVRPPLSLKFYPERYRKDLLVPVVRQSAAAHAAPAFEFGDEIIGCSDPEKDGAVTPLPPTPGNEKDPSSYEYRKRAVLMAGKPLTVRVRRADKSEADLVVPPAYHYTLGLRMRMGHVTAVRDDCPAKRAGVQVNGQGGDPKVEGDRIHQVEVVDALGRVVRWVRGATPDPVLPATGNAARFPFHESTTLRQQERQKAEGLLLLAPGSELAAALRSVVVGARATVVERDLDPNRLPAELQQWAAERRSLAPNGSSLPPGKVKLTVQRIDPKAHGQILKELEAEWDDSYRFDDEIPIGLGSPLSIAGLGLAYEVETTVEGVVPGSPAEKAGIQERDVIKEVCMFMPGKGKDDPPRPMEKPLWFFSKQKSWLSLEKQTEWGGLMSQFQQVDYKQLDLKIERGDETLEKHVDGVEDRTWPTVHRGYKLLPELRLQKAKNFGEAVTMGLGESFDMIGLIYRQISRLVSGRISTKNMSGPIGIFEFAYSAADTSFYTLILFLGIISVNLAVVNFLPIPILDGGHMVFLIYEGLRGKPASDQVRNAANVVGLGLIGSLMLFVIFMDLRRYF